MERVLFADSSLLDGLPQILAREPWARVVALVFDQLKGEYLDKLRQSRRYTGIRDLPEKLLDLLALDSLLHYYRDTDDLETKRENIENAWLIWSAAGTTYAVQKVADAFFSTPTSLAGSPGAPVERAATVEEWHKYGGEAHHYRVVVRNRAPDWAELRKFLEASYYFKRLSQKLDGVRIELTQEPPGIYIGAAAAEHRAEYCEVLPDTTAVFFAPVVFEHRTEYARV